MSKTATFFRAMTALGVALGGAWYLSVYSCSYPSVGGPGLPPGFAAVDKTETTIAGGRVRASPPLFSVGSLEHAHHLYLEALPRDAPDHLRFKLPNSTELDFEILAAKRAARSAEAIAGAESDLVLTTPVGRVERSLLFFAWEGSAGFGAEVEVWDVEAERSFARFRSTSAGGWYPSDAPRLAAGQPYRFRLVWNGGESSAREFRIATQAETNDYERARRAILCVSSERYRAVLEVLLAEADGRLSTALESARRTLTLHPDAPLAVQLASKFELLLGVK